MGMLLCLYIQDDRVNARFLWKRIPSELRQGKLAALWEVGKALWKNDYEEFYTTLNSTKYPPFQTQLINILKERFLARTTQLVGSAYSKIKVAVAAKYFGMDEEETTQYVSKFGWEVSNGYISPQPIAVTTDQPNFLQNNLHKLTKFA